MMSSRVKGFFLRGGLIGSLFILLIGLPCAGTFFGWDFYPPEYENRRLAEFPDFRSLPLAAWPEKAEGYFKDHFGFRNTFIRRYWTLMEDLFDRRSDRALEGLNGWLFLKDNGNISDFLGLLKLSESKMDSLRISFEGCQRWLEKRGVHYLLVVPPNKPVVYPEYLPEDIQAGCGVDGILQWRRFLEKKGVALNFLDLREELIANKSEKRKLYFSNDTHWSYFGSYLGYCAVIRRLSEWIPGLEPLPLSSCREVESDHEGDLVAMIGGGRPALIPCVKLFPKADLTEPFQVVFEPVSERCPLFDEVESVLVIRNPEKTGRVVIFHDSFGEISWKHFFPLHFEETVFISFSRPTPEHLQYVIHTFRPDVIINEQVHRNILNKPQPVCKEWEMALEGQN